MVQFENPHFENPDKDWRKIVFAAEGKLAVGRRWVSTAYTVLHHRIGRRKDAEIDIDGSN